MKEKENMEKSVTVLVEFAQNAIMTFFVQSFGMPKRPDLLKTMVTIISLLGMNIEILHWHANKSHDVVIFSGMYESLRESILNIFHTLLHFLTFQKFKNCSYEMTLIFV